MNKKPCEYCELGDNSKSLHCETNNAIALVEKGYIYVQITHKDNKPVDAQFTARYCPNCGRELKKAKNYELKWNYIDGYYKEWRAEGPWGTLYVFSDTEGVFTGSLNNEIGSEGDFTTVDEAKAYCQGLVNNFEEKI
ncbi:hypothetical protein [uncultured Sphaerochaeta sp.]|uniref:hypothetical protein n=1 Tax=uncultured Sphaerochaeta sp. TaxID=886478 RepID=UPI0029CA1EE9|nr:hypothetical protein [uncultured Sphaerochaeta sp.]